MSAIHLTNKNFEEKVIKAKKPVFVDFFAPWCGPCKMAAPIIDELAKEYAGKAGVYKVDVDEAQELAGKFGVMSIPTVIVFKEGKEVGRQVGFPGKEVYQEMIEKQL